VGIDLCSKDRVIRASHGTGGMGNRAIKKLDVGGDAVVIAAALEGDGEVVELPVVLNKSVRGLRLETCQKVRPRGLGGQASDGEVGKVQGLGLGVMLELEVPGPEGEDIALVLALLELHSLFFGHNPNSFHPVFGALGSEDETADHAEENWRCEGVGLSFNNSANSSGR
jgi:hypothetical protein